ncbi:transcription elongation factor GreA [Sedimentibacter sp. MB31-C6]|uniref:transcription elongation factor GreA n=1 Tax=Sedimentibacter sp. MB31-C6 TaxID=3109366 RepID=UPI002DDCAE1A|nr:transcription elongation factor GreA [Sedimentibacter sp. MB36-C1]WSI03412.1 transcription elongation factor GreA [Sedimentibacter sp. MB36-C1]
MDNEILVTEEGYQALIDELETRKTKTRKEIAERIKGALKEGDLSENAEYSESKDEQNKNESRIIVLEHTLKHVKIVKHNKKNKDIIQIGSKVKVKDLEFDEEMEFSLVGATEADPVGGKISNLSPLGSELLGKKKGERIDVASPGGNVRYEILEVN